MIRGSCCNMLEFLTGRLVLAGQSSELSLNLATVNLERSGTHARSQHVWLLAGGIFLKEK